MTATQSPERASSVHGPHAPAPRGQGGRAPMLDPRQEKELDDDLDDVDLDPESEGGAWWWAFGLWLGWLALVIAFSWGFYRLPSPGDPAFMEALGAIDIHQRVILLAIALAPLPLLLMGAVVSREVGKLRTGAQEALAVRRQEALPATASPAGALQGEIFTQAPAHIRREVERASHAIDALHVQLRNIEDALARQSAAVDEAADRAETRVRSIRESLREEREAFERLLSPLEGEDGQPRLGPAAVGEDARDALDALRMQATALEGQIAQGAERMAVFNEQMQALAAAQEGGDEAAAKVSVEEIDQARERFEAAAERVNATIEAAARNAARAIAEAAAGAAADASESGPSQERAQLRQQHLAELRRQVDRLREAERSSLQERLRDGALRDLPRPSFAAPEPPQPPESSPQPPQAEQEIAPEPIPTLVEPDLAPPSPSEPKPIPQPPEPPQPEPRRGAEPAEPAAAPRAAPIGRGLDWGKLVKAANFPDSEDDHETLDALYDVLTDAQAAALLQSSEDALAALADLDLYMEDHTPEMAPVNVWRAFLNGDLTNAHELAGLNAPAEISRVERQLSRDTAVSRIAVRFCERYEEMLRRMLRDGGDEGLLIDLADSRTGRAYMLLADALRRFEAA